MKRHLKTIYSAIALLFISSLSNIASDEYDHILQKLNAPNEESKVEALQFLIEKPEINLKPFAETIINLIDQETRVIIKDAKTGYRKTISPAKLATTLCINSNTNLLDQLSVALIDQRSSIRWRVAHILGEINNPESLPPLIMTLKNDPDRLVKMTAAESIAKFGELAFKPITELLDHSDPLAQEQAIWVLSEIEDHRILEKLLRIAFKQNNSVALQAMEALPKLGPDTAKALKAIMQDSSSSPELKQKAIYMAGKINNNEMYSELAQILTTSQDEQLRESALSALAQQNNIIATDLMLNMISDLNPNIAQHATEIMFKLGEASTPILLSYASNPDERIQKTSMQAFKALDVKATLALVSIINDPRFNEKVKLDAAKQLKAMRFPGVKISDMAKCLYLLEDWSSLSLIGKKILALHEERLNSEKPSDRFGAILLLSESEGPYYINRFIELLNDENIHVKQAAFNALLKLKRLAFPQLLALLNNEVSPRLKLAAQILHTSNYKPKTDADKLLFYSASEQWDKIREIGEPAQAFLFETLLNRNYDKSIWAAWALAKLHDHHQLRTYHSTLDEASLFELLQFKADKNKLNNPFEILSYTSDYRATALLLCLLFTHDQTLINQAIKAISEMKEIPLTMLNRCLASPNDEIQLKTLRCIESIGSETKSILTKHLNHPKRKEEILLLLEEFDYRPKSLDEEIIFLLSTHQYKKMVSKGRAGLIPLFKHIKESDDVSPSAYEALGTSENMDVIPILMDGLAHKNKTIVTSSEKALKQFGPAAIPLLKDYFKKTNITYAKLAAQSLKTLQYKASDDKEALWIEIISQHWAYLLKEENLEKVNKLLVPMLSSPDHAKRGIATSVLAGIRESFLALQRSKDRHIASNIQEALNSSSPDIRGRAVNLITKYGNDKVSFIPQLIKILDDNEAMLDKNGQKIQTAYGLQTPALIAANALAEIGLPAVPALLTKLKDRDAVGFAYAKLAASSIPDKRLVTHQIKLLSANMDTIKLNALNALTQIKAEEALPAMLTLYVNEHKKFTSEIQQSLLQFDQNLSPLIDEIIQKHPELPQLALLEVVAKQNTEEAASLLIREFYGKGLKEQRLIIELMASSTQSSIITHLISLLNYGAWSIEESAAQSLSEMGFHVTQPLIEAWISSPETYKKAAPRILKKTSGKNFGDRLEAWEKWLLQQK